MADMTDRATSHILALGAPAVFVLLWSSGFVGVKFGLPYAEPFTFLSTRFLIASGLMFLLAALLRSSRWPGSARETGHIIIAGLLLHGVYPGGVYLSIDLGMSVGVTAIIVGLQPVLTACLAGIMLGETVRPRQWLGFLLGFGGVVLVIGERMALFSAATLDQITLAPEALSAALLALLAITLATLYQKKFVPDMPLASGTAIQYAFTALATGLVALALEDIAIQWTGEFIFAIGWLVIVLSFGAVGLLLFLIRQNAASRLVSLFYLVPPTVALMSYFIFGESLGSLALTGMVLAAAGVALVVKERKAG